MKRDSVSLSVGLLALDGWLGRLARLVELDTLFLLLQFFYFSDGVWKR